MNTAGNLIPPRKWTNQYVHLVKTKSELIIAGGDQVSIQEKETVTTKAQHYPTIMVELGAGSGNHLVARAQLTPNTLWVGFELRFKRVFKTAQKAEAAGITNIIAIRNSAHHLTDFFGLNSIDGVFVNFPDPWDKKRWHKNRLMRDPFLTSVVDALKPSGFIAYKTDHQGSFEELEETLRKRKDGVISEVTRDLYTSPYLTQNVPTEFEQLFRRQKLPIYYLRWVKTHSAAQSLINTSPG